MKQHENTQALYSIEQGDDIRHYKAAEEYSIDDLLNAANNSNPFLKLMDMGEQISIGEYAEIQQSDRFSFSVEMNFDTLSGTIYEVNDGKGGIAEGDRTDDTIRFTSGKLSELRENKPVIIIKGYECIPKDTWEDHGVTFKIGQSVDNPSFYYARATDGKITRDYEYDREPDREKVMSDHADKLSEEYMDHYEAEHGADGYGAFSAPDSQERAENIRQMQDISHNNAEQKAHEVKFSDFYSEPSFFDTVGEVDVKIGSETVRCKITADFKEKPDMRGFGETFYNGGESRFSNKACDFAMVYVEIPNENGELESVELYAECNPKDVPGEGHYEKGEDEDGEWEVWVPDDDSASEKFLLVALEKAAEAVAKEMGIETPFHAPQIPEKEEREAHMNAPLILHDAQTARSLGENGLNDFRSSLQENRACAKAIIAAKNENTTYGDMAGVCYFDAAKTVDDVLAKGYPPKRLGYVIASQVVRDQKYLDNPQFIDGRFSRAVKEWAISTFSQQENFPFRNFEDCDVTSAMHHTLVNSLAEKFISKQAELSKAEKMNGEAKKKPSVLGSIKELQNQQKAKEAEKTVPQKKEKSKSNNQEL